MTSQGGSGRRGVPDSSVPAKPKINNIDSLLADIYVRYVALNAEDFAKYYNVIDKIYEQLQKKMKENDPYYNKYSSQVQFAGSHPDKLRIKKPDEFDIDNVIGLPLCIDENSRNPKESDFIIEPKEPGFIQIKVGVQFNRIPVRDLSESEINKTAYKWKDEKNYLLRSKFINYFIGVVDRALNCFVGNRIFVDGVPYTITRKIAPESSPAVTLFIENSAKKFKLDVDLVPALRFPTNRWPITNNYREIPKECEGAGKDFWMVVPKPNKNAKADHDKIRSWRIAMNEQEAMLLHDSVHMRQAIRLIKKLRDSQNMREIASYYIKTIFFWEVMEQQRDKTFWDQSPAVLFKLMLKKFHKYLVAGNIPYFWHKKNNLVENVNRANLNHYAAIVKKVLDLLDSPSRYKEVAKYLLTEDEFNEYNLRFLHI